MCSSNLKYHVAGKSHSVGFKRLRDKIRRMDVNQIYGYAFGSSSRLVGEGSLGVGVRVRGRGGRGKEGGSGYGSVEQQVVLVAESNDSTVNAASTTKRKFSSVEYA